MFKHLSVWGTLLIVGAMSGMKVGELAAQAQTQFRAFLGNPLHRVRVQLDAAIVTRDGLASERERLEADLSEARARVADYVANAKITPASASKSRGDRDEDVLPQTAAEREFEVASNLLTISALRVELDETAREREQIAAAIARLAQQERVEKARAIRSLSQRGK